MKVGENWGGEGRRIYGSWEESYGLGPLCCLRDSESFIPRKVISLNTELGLSSLKACEVENEKSFVYSQGKD